MAAAQEQFREKLESKRNNLLEQKNIKIENEIAMILRWLDITKLPEEDQLKLKTSAKYIAENKNYPEDYKLRILDNIQKNALENHFWERMYSDKLFHTFSDISNDIVYQRMLERWDIQNANLFLERKLTIYDYIDYLTPDEIEQFGLVDVYLAKNVKEWSNIDDKLNLRSWENTTTQKSEPDSNPNNNADSEILPSQKLDELIKELQINHKKLSGIILNTDISQWLTIWSDKWFERVKIKTDKIVLFFNILKELWMLDGVVLFSWDTPINTIRNSGYYAIFVPKVNKTIFINYEYWEATYACNWLVSIEQMTTFWKKELQTRLNAKKINFSESNINQWKYLIKQALWQNQENINISTYDTQINKQIIAHQIREKYKSLPEENKLEIKKRISSRSVYENKKNRYWDEIERVFGEKWMRTYDWLISKLLWDTKTTCRSKDYILALFESEEKWKEFLEEWEKEQEEKMSTEVIDKDSLKKIYWSFSDEEKKLFHKYTSSQKTYKCEKLNELFSWKLQRKVFPKVLSTLIDLLWWDSDSCMQHWYLEALLISEEEWQKYLERWNEEKKKNKEQNDKLRSKETEIRKKFKELSNDEQKKVFKCLSDENLYKEDLSGANSILRYLLWVWIWEEVPKSTRGFLGLLHWNAECRAQEYLYALFESQKAGKQYFDKRKKEKEENGKRLMDAQSIFESYRNMASKDRLYVDNYFDSHNQTSYEAEDLNPYFCKWKRNGKTMPKTLSWLIKTLWWNHKYRIWWYVKALLNNEWVWFITRITHIQKLQRKVNGDYIRNWYQNLTTEEKKSINRSLYEKEINKGKEWIFGKYFGEDFEWLPASYPLLISRLRDIPGSPECTKIEYLEALLKSKEDGKKYFDERKEKKEDRENKMMDIESIFECYQSMADKEKKQIIKYFESCSEKTYNPKEVEKIFCQWKREGRNMPSSLWVLIGLLKWNNKCCRWKYVIALLNGDWEEFFKKRENYMEKNRKLTWEKIREIFKGLNDVQKNEIYSCLTSHTYKEKIYILQRYFWKWVPWSLQAFIGKLWWDPKKQQKNYVISLLNQEM